MKPSSVGCFPRILFLMWIGLGAAPMSLSQAFAPPPTRDISVSAPMRERKPRALPGARLCCGNEIDYLGIYSSDGKFRTTTRIDRDNAGGRDSGSVSSGAWSRPSEVPDFINLHPQERVEENFEPPAHAVKPVRGKSMLASLRDDIVTFVYGRERILLAPHHVAVDSRGRILIVDPDIRAVHVMGNGDSFRIAGGAQRRLRCPVGLPWTRRTTFISPTPNADSFWCTLPTGSFFATSESTETRVCFTLQRRLPLTATVAACFFSIRRATFCLCSIWKATS